MSFASFMGSVAVAGVVALGATIDQARLDSEMANMRRAAKTVTHYGIFGVGTFEVSKASNGCPIVKVPDRVTGARLYADSLTGFLHNISAQQGCTHRPPQAQRDISPV